MASDSIPAKPRLLRVGTLALSWAKKHRRNQNWRNALDPYEVWISEVMLQQTQLVRAQEYFQRFRTRFPTMTALAKSSWRELLPYWRGLGYYHRAKNILRTAKHIQQERSGTLPSSEEELRSLPGIGPYTANAILSFAYGKPVAAVDTNLSRVLSRVFACDKSSLLRLAAKMFLLFPRRSAALNYALMDIGASICRPNRPLCPSCPLVANCHYAKNRKTKLPEPKRKNAKLTPAVHVGAACIHQAGEYLVAKRTRARGGEWEFPGGKREGSESIRACLKREIREELGVEISVRPAFHTEELLVGEKVFRIHFCRCQILRGLPKALEHEQIRWILPREMTKLRFAESNLPAVKKLQR